MRFEPLRDDAGQADAINPAYYKGDVECIDAIAEATRHLTGIEAVCTGNIIRYAWRWKEKGGADDLRKLIWYAERLLGAAGCRAAVEARGE